MSPSKGGRALPFVLLTAGCAIVFLGGLARLPLFGRDEALYAEAAREMLAGGDWITPRVNGVPFFEKPPLLYWLAALTYKIVGVSPLAARLPAALMAIFSVGLTAAVGACVWGRRAGILAGIALATSLQMVMIGRMGIMDVPLTCLVALALLAYAHWQRKGGLLAALAFGALAGLALLLKGLAGILAPAIAFVHALVHRRHHSCVTVGSVGAALLVTAAIAGPWFVAMGLRHGEAYTSVLFLREHMTRITRPMQGHGGPIVYYIALIAVSFFPWAVFLPVALISRHHQTDEARTFWHRLLIVWIAVVLILFSLASTKLPGYVTPLFPAMALLVGVELDRRLLEPGRAPWIAVIAGAVLLGGLVSLLPVAGARIGARVGASHEARLLTVPAAFWVGGYGIIALGAAVALVGRVGTGLRFMVAGQAVILGALLIGILPVLSPYLGGASARLAEVARRELPDSRVVLYDTRPETVAFVLRRPVPEFSRDQQRQILAALRTGPTALIASAKERAFWQQLPARRVWRSGDRVLVEVPNLAGRPESGAELR